MDSRPSRFSPQIPSGFTLIEIVVVVLVLGIIGSIALPRLGDFSRQARLKATITHLISIAGAAERFHATHGRWTADGYPNQLPSDFVGIFRAADFGKSPIGGYYDWNGPGSGFAQIGISITHQNDSNLSNQDMQAIDEMIDDGNHDSGLIRWEVNRLVYVQDDYGVAQGGVESGSIE